MAFLSQFLILAPYLFATLVAALVAMVLLRDHREVPERVYFGTLMVSVACWSLLNFFEDASAEWETKLFLSNLQYPFISAIPVLFFRFACRHAFDRDVAWLEARWLKTSLWVVPSLLSLAVWFDPEWGLVRSNLRPVLVNQILTIGRDWGPGFYVFFLFSYALIAVSLGLWVWVLWQKRKSRVSSFEGLLNLTAVVLPLVANILQVTGTSPWTGHDLTTPAFSLMGLILLISFSRNRFLSLLPTAQESVLATWAQPLLIFDRRGHLAYFNRMAAQSWGLSRADQGRNRAALPPALAWLPLPFEGKTMATDPANGKVWEVEEQPLKTPGPPQGSAVTLHDVSSFEARVAERTQALEDAYFRLSDELQHRRRTEQQLFYYSLHDSLTGLGNRSLFLSRLSQALERSKRTPGMNFGVVMLNFRGFKKINEQLGHAAGDDFLFQTALRLSKAIRSVDTAARSSADTFLILLDSVSGPEFLGEAAERIRQEVESPLVLNGSSVVPEARLALVWGTSEHTSPESVLDDAEIALSRTDAAQNGPPVFFNPEWRNLQKDRNLLKDELGIALVRGDLHLQFQPIVSLSTGKLLGYEALSRWTHPTRGLVPPNVFIPLAEKEGTIKPLGLWVLREAARAFVALGRLSPAARDTFVSVNVSPLQLSEPDFGSILLGLLAREGLEPSRLHLEITETALVENSMSLVPVLHLLKSAGINIKLDDFGTGYSSLHSLHRLPVSTLKIDRSFVLELPQGAAIIRTIVGLAAELRLDIVAEGVETKDQRDQLRALGCGAGQGYWFSRGWRREELELLYRNQGPGPVFLDEKPAALLQ